MAKYIGLALDPQSHDLFVDASGNLAVATDADAVGQLCKQRLKTYLGEWFLDQTVGVPWFQQVFVRPFNEAVADSIVKRTLLRTLGVRALTGFEMSADFTIRRLDVMRADVVTEFDETVELAL